MVESKTAVKIVGTDSQTLRIPSHSGFHRPTDNVKRCIKHGVSMPITQQDITGVIENGEVVEVESVPQPKRLSKGRPEITYRGQAECGRMIDVDVSPSGTTYAVPNSDEMVSETDILRVREARSTATDPLHPRHCSD